jgi:DNA-binding response OmpR family regulator
MRVLVVEDHTDLAQSLGNGLREEGYAVDIAADGKEGDHLLKSVTYDCVVLDIMLPHIDGFTLLKELRERGARTPVLLLTAKDQVDDRVRGLDLGGDDYLLKPFAWTELLARVRALIRRSNNQASSKIEVGDLTLDTAAKQAMRVGKRIDLTAREYSLLELLALKQGQVVSRSEIWNHLYDWNDESTSNVVDVYIGYLRSKIDLEGLPKLIHTRRGQGYLLGVLESAQHS